MIALKAVASYVRSLRHTHALLRKYFPSLRAHLLVHARLQRFHQRFNLEVDSSYLQSRYPQHSVEHQHRLAGVAQVLIPICSAVMKTMYFSTDVFFPFCTNLVL